MNNYEENMQFQETVSTTESYPIGIIECSENPYEYLYQEYQRGYENARYQDNSSLQDAYQDKIDDWLIKYNEVRRIKVLFAPNYDVRVYDMNNSEYNSFLEIMQERIDMEKKKRGMSE